jgi:hypothetical protein
MAYSPRSPRPLGYGSGHVCAATNPLAGRSIRKGYRKLTASSWPGAVRSHLATMQSDNGPDEQVLH